MPYGSRPLSGPIAATVGPIFDAATLEARPRGVGGHGLVVVAGLSTRWGTRRVESDAGERFCVWFELDVAGGVGGGILAGEAIAGAASERDAAEPPVVAAES